MASAPTLRYRLTKVDFNGKRKDFPKYEVQLKATLGVEGWTQALSSNFDNLLPSTEAEALNEADAGDKKKIEAREINAKVVNMIVLGQKDVKMINMIETIKTDDWPTGKAHEIWSEMRRRFAPDDDVAEMDMEDALAKIKLGAKEDPWDLNDKIAAVQIKYSHKIPDTRKATIIMRAGKVHYAAITASTSQMIRMRHSRAAQAKELLAEMHTQWRIERCRDDDGDDEPTEAALADPMFLSKKK